MPIEKFKNMQVKSMMEHFGFRNVEVYYFGNNTNEGFDIVSNRILEKVRDYVALNKEHFGEDVNVYDNNTKETAITNDSKRDDSTDMIDGGVCYWVTGHSMGGAVANLVASSIICSDMIPDLNVLEGNSQNVYCYTFAAPNTFYLPDNKFEEQITLENKYEGEWREPKGNKYI